MEKFYFGLISSAQVGDFKVLSLAKFDEFF